MSTQCRQQWEEKDESAKTQLHDHESSQRSGPFVATFAA